MNSHEERGWTQVCCWMQLVDRTKGDEKKKNEKKKNPNKPLPCTTASSKTYALCRIPARQLHVAFLTKSPLNPTDPMTTLLGQFPSALVFQED